MQTRHLALAVLAGGSALLLAAVLVFGLWPGLDLRVSALAGGASGFVLARDPAAILAREAFWTSTSLAALAALGWASVAVARRRGGWRVPAFVLAAYVLGPGLLANVILKDHWGRARPRDITAFGGEAAFTSPLHPAAECARNCSFVSGEGSALVAMAIALTLALWPVLPRRWRGPAAGLAGLWAAAGSALRIAFGGHFLSDTVFAAAFMAILTPALWLAIVGRGLAPQGDSPAAARYKGQNIKGT